MIRPLVVAAAVAASSTALAQLSENFDDSNAATRWSAPIVDSEVATFDGSVDYAFDYGAAGIPAAPNGGGAIGVRFAANQTDESSGDEGEAIGIIANGSPIPAGNVQITMDVYYNVDAGSESVATEYVNLGAFTAAPAAPADLGLNDDVPFRFGVSDGNGLSWSITGDGGSATDLVRFEDAGNAGTGSQTNLGSLDDIPFGTIPGVTTGAGNPNNPFEQFGFQNRWVTLKITNANGIATYQVNDTLIDFIDGSAYSGGSVLIGLTDVFNSAAGDGVFTVIDNVVVSSIPEPTSAVIALLSLGGLLAGRRR